MAKPTVRDIHEMVNGLLKVANEMREVGSETPLANYTPPAVPVGLTGLLGHASYIEGVATGLRELIPDDDVDIEDDT